MACSDSDGAVEAGGGSRKHYHASETLKLSAGSGIDHLCPRDHTARRRRLWRHAALTCDESHPQACGRRMSCPRPPTAVTNLGQAWDHKAQRRPRVRVCAAHGPATRCGERHPLPRLTREQSKRHMAAWGSVAKWLRRASTNDAPSSSRQRTQAPGTGPHAPRSKQAKQHASARRQSCIQAGQAAGLSQGSGGTWHGSSSGPRPAALTSFAWTMHSGSA